MEAAWPTPPKQLRLRRPGAPKLRRRSVDEEPNLKASQAHVRQELRVMERKQLIDALCLDHDLSFDDDVQPVATVELDSLVRHGERLLPLEGESTETELVTETLFVGGFEQPRPEGLVNLDGRPSARAPLDKLGA